MTDRCPKCAHPVDDDSCPRCGLVFAKFDENVLLEGVPPEIIDLWRQLEGDWQNQKLHALFVERALLCGDGGFAASRYRAMGDDPLAASQLAHLTERLEQMLIASRDGQRPKGKLGLLLLLGGLALALIGTALVLLRTWR